jgi:hypothetical protein
MNTVNEACAAILLGGSENIISATNTFANVANTTLGGDVCPRATPKVLLRGPSSSQGHSFIPAQP